MAAKFRCRLGRHKWAYDEARYDPQRWCLRCPKRQVWVDAYQNSGWEGSDFEPAHWRDS